MNKKTFISLVEDKRLSMLYNIGMPRVRLDCGDTLTVVTAVLSYPGALIMFFCDEPNESVQDMGTLLNAVRFKSLSIKETLDGYILFNNGSEVLFLQL